MQLHCGTSGYSYKEWKGSFYPDDLAAKDMLTYYGERLGAVEINNTFYRLPKAEVVENWAAQVPPSFRFSIKANRRITHFKRLEDVGDETAYLLETLERLGEHLGVILFQLPPNSKCDLERLRAFLELLPPGTPAAFEFRNESWSNEDVHAALAERGCALCVSDVDDADPPALVRTADWGYVRLRRRDYDDDQLSAWRTRIAEQDWQRAFVFFKHEDEGAGPRLAARFMESPGA